MRAVIGGFFPFLTVSSPFTIIVYSSSIPERYHWRQIVNEKLINDEEFHEADSYGNDYNNNYYDDDCDYYKQDSCEEDDRKKVSCCRGSRGPRGDEGQQGETGAIGSIGATGLTGGIVSAFGALMLDIGFIALTDTPVTLPLSVQSSTSNNIDYTTANTITIIEDGIYL